jgi:hypothetical protein
MPAAQAPVKVVQRIASELATLPGWILLQPSFVLLTESASLAFFQSSDF